MNESCPLPPVFQKAHRDGDVHLLRELMRAHQALLATFSREVGMPASRLAVMRILAIAASEPMGVMEIARHLEVNAAVVTRQVQEMEREHLVVRRPDPQDKRRFCLSLSAKGLKAFEELHRRSHDLERSLTSVVDAKEIRVAAKVLAALRGVLDGLR